MIYLLDTDHFSIFQRKAGVEHVRLSSRLLSYPRTDIGVSVVSSHEQMLGCHTYLSRSKTPADLAKGYERLHKVLTDFIAALVVPFDSLAAATFQSLKAAPVRLDPMDLRIAAVALANNLTLLTRNSVDLARVPGLIFDDWVS